MSKLHVEAEQTAAATPEAVWALVSDATRYPQWGPWQAAGYRQAGDTEPHGPGAVRWLRSAQRAYGRRPLTVERILVAQAPRHLAYTVIGGIPVRNYQSEVTLTPVPDGTHIRWSADWDDTWRGRIVHRGLRVYYPQVVAALAAAAERDG